MQLLQQDHTKLAFLSQKAFSLVTDSQDAERQVCRMWGRESTTTGAACRNKQLTFSNYTFLSLTL